MIDSNIKEVFHLELQKKKRHTEKKVGGMNLSLENQKFSGL